MTGIAERGPLARIPLGMTGHGLAQLHAEQAAWDAARDMRSHLAKHTVEDWLSRYPRGAS